MKNIILLLIFSALLAKVLPAQNADNYLNVSRIILSEDEVIYVPDMLTPNGDGYNDTWLIGWTPEFNRTGYRLGLMSSSGQTVFTMTPLRSGWDGGNLSEGTYMWTIFAGGSNRRVGSGNLIINRQNQQQRTNY